VKPIDPLDIIAFFDNLRMKLEIFVGFENFPTDSTNELILQAPLRRHS
jgi:hypothetical protein